MQPKRAASRQDTGRDTAGRAVRLPLSAIIATRAGRSLTIRRKMKGAGCMARPNLSKPLKARAIYINGSDTPLTDKVIFLTDHFLIIGEHENDTAPTWLNIDQVTRVEGVEAIAPPTDTDARREQAQWLRQWKTFY